jgi:CheY-like chemotaxis protein
VLSQDDLGEIFEWLAGQCQARHGLTVHVEVRGRVHSQSEPLKGFLLRAAQEVLFNAFKHANVDEVTVRLQRRRGSIWLTISDRGDGFDVHQVGQTAGFGLMSIRERAELLSGQMRIRSAAGRGSTFLIRVPDAGGTAPAEGRADESCGPPAAQPRPREARKSTGGPIRVLLVDDHKIMRDGLSNLLGGQQDIEVVGEASNGAEAIERARRLRPDAIVMDVAMPVMAGDEATYLIRREMPEVRIVALSMFEEPGVARKLREAGADVYLTKSGPSEDVLNAIRG